MRSDNTQGRGTARGGARETTRKWDGERRSPNRRYSAGDGSDYSSAEDSSVRRNNYGERSDSRPRRTFGGNSGSNDSRPFKRNYSNDRREGNAGERREGGFNRERSFGERREGGYNRERSFGERNDRGERREGGFNRERSFGERREGGFNRERSFGERREGGYNRERSFGERNDRGERREGGFSGKKIRSRINKPNGSKPNGYATPDKPAREDGVRLNKYIANSGICSRREADNFIQAGLVTVNDVIITELGTRVDPAKDVVKFNGEKLRGEDKVYIVMNKPKDFITTMSDPHAEKTVMNLIEGNCQARVFPVGRLDKATTGVLLLTNDGDLTERLTHPSYEKKKIYHVHLDKNFRSGDFSMLLEGIILEDGAIKADALSYIDNDKSQIGIEIHSGRNRVVRRLFEHLGYKVKKLDRVYFAGLTKKNLRRGQWRFLTDQEIAMLKMGNYE